jgi:elongation factor Ts
MFNFFIGALLIIFNLYKIKIDMSISAQDVNKLRKMTGAGMMDCKKALAEANGDFDKAIEILRKKGQKISASRSEKETNEGVIVIQTNSEENIGVIVSLNCETDFVAKNEEFQSLGKQIAEIAFEKNPSSIEELKSQPIGSLTIADKLLELVGKIGEKIEIGAYQRLEGEKIVPYIHAGSRLGVLVALKGTQNKDVAEAGKDVAMQIAAMNPVAVDKDNVDASIIERELEIGREQARAEGKPENMLDKIAEGKLNKFYKESTLLNQAFVKDNSVTVSKYLDSVVPGMTVSGFKRVSVTD